MCWCLRVSSSGYDGWGTRVPSARTQEDARLLVRIRVLHAAHDGVVGSRRIWKGLCYTGERYGRHRMARLLRRAGLQVPAAAPLAHQALWDVSPSRVFIGDCDATQIGMPFAVSQRTGYGKGDKTCQSAPGSSFRRMSTTTTGASNHRFRGGTERKMPCTKGHPPRSKTNLIPAKGVRLMKVA